MNSKAIYMPDIFSQSEIGMSTAMPSLRSIFLFNNLRNANGEDYSEFKGRFPRKYHELLDKIVAYFEGRSLVRISAENKIEILDQRMAYFADSECFLSEQVEAATRIAVSNAAQRKSANGIRFYMINRNPETLAKVKLILTTATDQLQQLAEARSYIDSGCVEDMQYIALVSAGISLNDL